MYESTHIPLPSFSAPILSGMRDRSFVILKQFSQMSNRNRGHGFVELTAIYLDGLSWVFLILQRHCHQVKTPGQTVWNSGNCWKTRKTYCGSHQWIHEVNDKARPLQQDLGNKLLCVETLYADKVNKDLGSLFGHLQTCLDHHEKEYVLQV